jgi:hypothetical protein
MNDGSYYRINSVWNHENYYLAKDDSWKNRKTLELQNNEYWIPFVTESENEDSKRLLLSPFSWLNPLEVPKDCYELMYRLGLF